MKHTIRTCIAFLLCFVLSFAVFPQMVSAEETGDSSSVTEETSPTETLVEELEHELGCGITDTQSVEPRDEDDNF